jgi:hypothetical protein
MLGVHRHGLGAGGARVVYRHVEQLRDVQLEQADDEDPDAVGSDPAPEKKPDISRSRRRPRHCGQRSARPSLPSLQSASKRSSQSLQRNS